MADFSPAEIAVLESSTVRIGTFFRIATDPVVRVWLGIGDIAVGVDVHDPGGALYRGLGELRDVPTFSQVVNGRAERIEVGLSGVTPEIVAAFVEQADKVKFRAADIGLGIFGSDWQMLGSVHWIRRGYVDYAAVTDEAGERDGAGIRIISLSIGGLMTGRRRAVLGYWTDQDQQRRSPGDRFCERTVYLNEVDKGWPIFPG